MKRWITVITVIAAMFLNCGDASARCRLRRGWFGMRCRAKLQCVRRCSVVAPAACGHPACSYDVSATGAAPAEMAPAPPAPMAEGPIIDSGTTGGARQGINGE